MSKPFVSQVKDSYWPNAEVITTRKRTHFSSASRLETVICSAWVLRAASDPKRPKREDFHEGPISPGAILAVRSTSEGPNPGRFRTIPSVPVVEAFPPRLVDFPSHCSFRKALSQTASNRYCVRSLAAILASNSSALPTMAAKSSNISVEQGLDDGTTTDSEPSHPCRYS